MQHDAGAAAHGRAVHLVRERRTRRQPRTWLGLGTGLGLGSGLVTPTLTLTLTLTLTSLAPLASSKPLRSKWRRAGSARARCAAMLPMP